MKLLHMRACFGVLKQELSLEDGLNLFELPNESGKSTWCAFLLAMLYGVPSAERAGKGKLPAKQRYLPWSGGLMEGSIELEQDGRRITIERTGTKSAPMSRFRAYDSDSGAPIAGMTAENCGLLLTGAERSVFERSAFLGQAALPVTTDTALEQRLNALVTTGDDGASYLSLNEQLHTLRNHLKYNKSGKIPSAEAELYRVEQQLQELHRLSAEAMAHAAEQLRWQEVRKKNQRLLALIQAARDRKRRTQLSEAEAEAERLRGHLAELEQAVAPLPDFAELELLRSAVRTLEQARCSHAMEEAMQPPAPPALPVFAGKSAEAAVQTAKAAANRLSELESQTPPPRWPVLVASLLFLAALALGALISSPLRFLPAAVCALGLLLLVSHLVRGQRRAAAAQQERARLLADYQAENGAAILSAAQRYGEALLLAQETRHARDQQTAQLQARETALLQRIAGFAPSCAALSDAPRCLDEAAALRRQADDLRRSMRQAEQHVQSLRLLSADAQTADLPEDFDETAYDVPRLQQELTYAQQRCTALHGEIENCYGKLSMLGDRAELEARQEALTESLQRWTREYDALTTAMSLLQEANDTLAQRFAPQLTRLAGELFSKLTDGRYEALLLNRKLEPSARPQGDTVMRPSLALSCGTVDQLYLSLRLAIAALLLPQDTPLVLDDALTNFDDARCLAALRVLRELAQTRQILLFTCHSRERRLLAQDEAPR